MTRTALVILGMHRSGTSSVAGALSLLGAAAPKTLLEPAPDNPKGFWESREIVQFNDRVLQAGQSWWNDWRDFDFDKISKADVQAFQEEIPALLSSEFDEASTIVLKDPRLCRLWSLWEPAVQQAGYRPLYVIPLRSPLEVAKSLAARNGFSLAEGMVLWLQHVLEAERTTRGAPRCILMWEDFMQDWREEVHKLEKAIAWRAPTRNPETEAAVDEFLAPDLRRQRADCSDLAGRSSHPWAAEGFRLMAALAECDDNATHSDIDSFAHQFKTANALYGAALGPVLWNAHTSAIYQAERDQARAEVVRLSQETAAAHAAVEDGAAALKVEEGERRHLEEQLTIAARDLAALGARLSDQASAIDWLGAHVAFYEQRHADMSEQMISSSAIAHEAAEAMRAEIAALSDTLNATKLERDSLADELEHLRTRAQADASQLAAKLAIREVELETARQVSLTEAASAAKKARTLAEMEADIAKYPLRTWWRVKRRVKGRTGDPRPDRHL